MHNPVSAGGDGRGAPARGLVQAQAADLGHGGGTVRNGGDRPQIDGHIDLGQPRQDPAPSLLRRASPRASPGDPGQTSPDRDPWRGRPRSATTTARRRAQPTRPDVARPSLRSESTRRCLPTDGAPMQSSRPRESAQRAATPTRLTTSHPRAQSQASSQGRVRIRQRRGVGPPPRQPAHQRVQLVLDRTPASRSTPSRSAIATRIAAATSHIATRCAAYLPTRTLARAHGWQDKGVGAVEPVAHAQERLAAELRGADRLAGGYRDARSTQPIPT